MLVCECLGILPEELVKVTRERAVLASLLKMLPLENRHKEGKMTTILQTQYQGHLQQL